MLWDATSRGLCGRVGPPHTNVRAAWANCERADQLSLGDRDGTMWVASHRYKGVPKEEWGKAGPTMHRSASVAVTLAVAATVDAFTPHRMLAGARGPEVRAKLVSVSAALLFTHVRCAVWPSAQRGKTEECACAVSARAPADAMSGCESIPGATQLQPTPVVKRADERGPGRN